MSFVTFPAILEGSSIKNTAIGTYSLSQVTPGTLTGNTNTAFGYASLQFTTTGRFNTGVGSEALQRNTTGNSNTAVGDSALENNTTGTFNTAVGRLALSSSDSIGSTAFGANALSSATGGGNTAIGYASGNLITSGQNNTILGPYSGNQGGLDIRTSSNYVVISDGSGNPRIIVDPAGLVSAPGGFSGGGGGGALTFNNQTAAYTVVSGDLGKIVNCTANTFTVSLTAAATLGAGFNCWVWNTGTGVITIDPNGVETIDGVATLTLRKGEGTQIVCNGTNWETGDKKTMRGYSDNLASNVNRPRAEGNDSVAIGRSAVTQPGGSLQVAIGPFCQAQSDYCVSIGGFSNTINAYSVALGYSTTAGSGYSTAIGNSSSGFGATTATNNGAMAFGNSYASGTDSFSVTNGNNTGLYGATGASSVAIGQNSRAQNTGSYCFSGGIASAPYSFAIGGVASGNSSLVLSPNGGASATAFASYAMGLGGLSSVTGKLAFGYSSTGQAGNFPMLRTTTDATATPLTTDGSAAGSLNQIILPNNAVHAFHGTIVARQQASGGTQSAAWRIEGLIRREANAATTTLVASTVSVISNVPGWTVALSADTTNGGLAITVTGAVGTNIRWAANINTSEVTYP